MQFITILIGILPATGVGAIKVSAVVIGAAAIRDFECGRIGELQVSLTNRVLCLF